MTFPLNFCFFIKLYVSECHFSPRSQIISSFILIIFTCIIKMKQSWNLFYEINDILPWFLLREVLSNRPFLAELGIPRRTLSEVAFALRAKDTWCLRLWNHRSLSSRERRVHKFASHVFVFARISNKLLPICSTHHLAQRNLKSYHSNIFIGMRTKIFLNVATIMNKNY